MRQRILKGGLMHALGLASLGMLLVPNAAHAGHWSFTGTMNNNGVSSPLTNNGSWSENANAPIQYGPNGFTVNSTFVFTVVGTWLPDYSGDTSQPPPSMLVSTTDAAVSANPPANPPGQSYGSVTASDGEGDSQVNTNPGDYHMRVVIGTSAGKHLVPVTNGSFSITLTMTSSASGMAYVGGGSGLTITPDDRSITLGPNTSAKVPLVAENQTQVDLYGNTIYAVGPGNQKPGLTHSDIGLPVGSTDDTTTHYYDMTYGAACSGSWTLIGGKYNWYSSLYTNDLSGNMSSAQPSPPTFLVSYVEPTDLGWVGETGHTDHVHLTVIDGSDGAQASGNMYVTLHQPYESILLSGPTSTKDLNYFSFMTYPGTVASGMLVGQPGTVNYSESSAVYSALNSSGNLVTACSATVAIADPVIAAIMAAAGVVATNVLVDGSPAPVLWSTLWPTSASQWKNTIEPPYWSPGVSADSLPAGEAGYCVCNSVNIKVAYTNKSYYECDHWGTTGYLGSTNYLLGTNPAPSPTVDTSSASWTYSGPQ